MDPQPISGSSLSGIKRSAPSEADKIGHTLSLPASCCFSPPKVEILPFFGDDFENYSGTSY